MIPIIDMDHDKSPALLRYFPSLVTANLTSGSITFFHLHASILVAPLARWLDTESPLFLVFMRFASKNAKVFSITLGSPPQRLEYLHMKFALELIESVLTNHHELFCKVRTSSSSFHTINPYFPVMFIALGTLTLIPTPLLPATSQNACGTLRFRSHAPQISIGLSLA